MINNQLINNDESNNSKKEENKKDNIIPFKGENDQEESEEKILDKSFKYRVVNICLNIFFCINFFNICFNII